MTAKDSEALLKALVGLKREIDEQSRQLINVIKLHVARHPSTDEKFNSVAHYCAEFHNRSMGLTIRNGGSVYGVRKLISQRFEGALEKVIALRGESRSVDRWCRTCAVVTEMILLSAKENDLSFLHSDAFRLAVDLLKEGALHDPDGNDGKAFLLNRSEQDKIVQALKDVAKAFATSQAKLGLGEHPILNQFLEKYHLSPLRRKFKNVKTKDRAFAFFFEGNKKGAILSTSRISYAAEYINQVSAFSADYTDFDVLCSAELWLSVDVLYFIGLFVHQDLMPRNKSLNQMMIEAKPKFQVALNSALNEIDPNTPEAIAFKSFVGASNKRVEKYKRVAHEQLGKHGVKHFIDAVELEELGPIFAKCLNVAPDVFVRQRDLTKAGIKGKSIAGGIKRRGDSAHLDDDLSGKTLYGEKPGCMLGILDNGATVSWKVGRCRKTCDLSAKHEVNFFGRLFRASLNGSSGLDANLVYVTSVLWEEVKRTARKRGKYAIKKAKCNKEKVAAEKSLASLNQFFTEVVICDSKNGKRRYDEVPERQIVKKGNEKPKFVYRAYLNPLYVSNGARLPQK